VSVVPWVVVVVMVTTLKGLRCSTCPSSCFLWTIWSKRCKDWG